VKPQSAITNAGKKFTNFGPSQVSTAETHEHHQQIARNVKRVDERTDADGHGRKADSPD
jgi:hypothetical protein